jgi:hypothetical protein
MSIKAACRGRSLPPIDFKLPVPEVRESNAEFWWALWDEACAQVDDQADWAVSHPFSNARVESQALASSSVRSVTDIGREPIFLGGGA